MGLDGEPDTGGKRQTAEHRQYAGQPDGGEVAAQNLKKAGSALFTGGVGRYARAGFIKIAREKSHDTIAPYGMMLGGKGGAAAFRVDAKHRPLRRRGDAQAGFAALLGFDEEKPGRGVGAVLDKSQTLRLKARGA